LHLKTQAYHLLLFLYLTASSLQAQGPHPAFRQYTTDQGLPSSEVFEVIQDRRGYLWFGTDNGVARFNGYEFEQFGPAQGLANNVVFYLHEDHWGRIWMVTMSHNLYYYDYQLDSILAYPYNHLIQEKVNRTGFDMGLYIDSLENLYQTASRDGIYRISPEGEFSWLPVKDSVDQIIHFAIEGRELLARFTMVDKGIRMKRINSRLPIYQFHSFKGPGIPIGEIRLPEGLDKKSIPFSGPPNFYAVGEASLIFNFKGKTILFRNAEPIWRRQELEFVIASGAYSKEGEVLLGGNFGAGLRKYPDLAALQNDNYQSFLKGNSISHILRDKDEGFWLTSIENGIFYFQNWDIGIYDQRSGLPDDFINSITFRNDSILYLALKNGTLLEMNISSQNIKRLGNPGLGEIYDIFWNRTKKQLRNM